MKSVTAIDLENVIIREDLMAVVGKFFLWEFFRSKTILITGGGGLLASYLVRSLLLANQVLGLNLKVTCLLRSQHSSPFRLAAWSADSSLRFVYGNVETFDYARLERHDIVIHAASGASPKAYSLDPVGIILPNALGTLKLCEQACKWHSERLLFFSTGEIYGINSTPRFLENDLGYLDPALVRSCYAESKRCGETICVAFSHQYKLHTVLARIFHTYGPQMMLDDGRVFADFIRDALEGNGIRLASAGDAKRCFCYLSDATRAFLLLIASGVSGEAYNMANPQAEISIRDLAHLVGSLSSPPIPVRGEDGTVTKPGYLPSQVPRSLPNTAKLESLGWQPFVGLEEGFRRTLHSYSA